MRVNTLVFSPKLCTLGYTKPVLLIYNAKSEVFELYGILDQCVRTDDNVQCAIQQLTVNDVPLLFFC
ncbi:hypothetical protein D3C86_2009420 [compost metagenome]